MAELLTTQSVPAGYTAALEGAAFIDESMAGRIFMRGRDRAELLHRLSTADIRRLKPGYGLRTVLTTPIGRIIDLLTVYALDDALLLETSLGQGALSYSHLRKNIFFNDQVTLEAAGRSHGQLRLVGQQAAALVAERTGVAVEQLPLHSTTTVTWAGAEVLLARSLPIGGQSFTLFVPAAHLDAVRADLLEAGAVQLSDQAFDILRIEQGYGAFGRELSQEYIPLETGLRDAISFSKGCYVGQEIIARMDSRGRMAKQLRGLRLSLPDAGDPAEALGALTLPTKLDVDGKEAGDLTSVALSPRFGPIALAYVRSAHAEPGSRVGIANSALVGEVVALPFESI